MNRLLHTLPLTLLALITAFAQPVIRPSAGVLNSASYLTPGLPGAGIAQGSMFVVFGTGLGPSQLIQADHLPLDTVLSDTSIDIRAGGTTYHALMVYTYASQLAAVLPSAVPTGKADITVKYKDGTSAPVQIDVAPTAFGIYTFGASGSGQAIATDLNYAKNTIIRTFRPGDIMVLWGTGLGKVRDSTDDAHVGNLPVDVKVYVGNTAVDSFLYHGRAGVYPGLDQIQFHVPANVEGCAVPVGVLAGGVLSNITTIAVSRQGSTCTDSVMGQGLVDKLASGQDVRFGYVRLESGTRLGDRVLASFSRHTPAMAGLAQYGVSPGYCMAIDCTNGCGMLGSPADMSPGQLGAGDLSLQGPMGTIAIQGYAGMYGSMLNPNGGRFLYIGRSYTVSVTGAAEVAAFTQAKDFNSAFTQFANISEQKSIPRSSDFNVTWNTADYLIKDGLTSINGLSVTDNNALMVYLQCTAPVAPGSFTIPAWVLSALPASGSTANGYPTGYMWIGQYDSPTSFKATGLDKGLMTDITFALRTVRFQ